MRSCGSCGHANADHLAYCFACGRRLRPLGEGPLAGRPDEAVTIANVPAGAAGMPAGLAATIALETMGPGTTGQGLAGGRRHPISRAYQAARYVFTTIRGRMDAEDRRRHLVAETDGARRMAEGTLVEIGQTVLAQGITHPDLQGLVDSLIKQRARRDTVGSDLAAAEKFQASEDLRLGLLESAAENEWKSCADAAREAELALGRNEAEKREAREALAKHHAARIGGGPPPATDRATLDQRLATLDAQYRTLRERAAALRASTLAAKTRLEQATANRRQAAAAVSASVAGHTRERGELDADIRTLTTRIGLAALERRVPSPFLTAAYERFDRLQATARGHQTELARIERSKSGIDRPRFAAGLGLILGVLGACGAGLWALLR